MGNGWDDLQLDPVPGTPGTFDATISDAWMLVAAPLGGVTVALAARAMAHTLGASDQSLRSLSAVFAGRVNCGPVEIEVGTLREGRSMSQLTATVRNPGEPAGLTAIAVFGSPRRGFDFTDLEFPHHLPGPDGLRSFRDPIPDDVDFEFARPPMRFWEEIVEGRPAIGRPPWEPHVPGPAEAANWYRIDDPPLGDDGLLDPLVPIVLCDTMPSAVFQRVGPDEQWFGPSADFTIHLFNPARPGWLLAHNQARHAGDGYASVELALWDPAGPTLVAHASQVMFFAFGV